MWSIVERLLPRRPEERLSIESDSHSSLVLRHGHGHTVFDRLTRAVTQQGRQVATFGAVHHVQLSEVANEAGGTVWLVTLQLRGSREFAVGRADDSDQASLAAARIAAITGAQVSVKLPS